MLRIFSVIFVGIWVSRYLGPEKFGILSYALAFTTVFANVARLGLDNLVIQRLTNCRARHDLYMGTAFWMKLFGSTLTFAVMTLILLLNADISSAREYIFILGISIFFQSFEVIDYFYQAHVKSKVPSAIKMVQLLLLALFRIFLILISAKFILFIVAIVLDQIILSILMYLIYKVKGDGYFINKFHKKIAFGLMKKSWPFMINGLIIILYMRIDQLMIKQMLGDSAVGIYSAAARLSEAFYFIPMVISSSLFPAIINSKKTNIKKYYSRLQRLYFLQIWLALFIIIFVTFSANWGIRILYGDAYIEAAPVLVISVWGSLFIFFGVVKGRWMVLENMQFYATINALVGLLINVIFNLFLIPYLGIIGAAVATLAAQFFSAIVIPVFSKKDRVSVEMFFNSLILRNKYQNS
jgi:O-antigen/teichoic acid export membrane protein